jgi:RNA polymerase sigma-70 factor (ECF subfamily)
VGDHGTNVELSSLLARVAAGDRGAFDELYERVSAIVYGLARRVVVDRSIASEVAQEVLLEVWRTADRFDPARGTATAWIATMTRRRAIDAVRSVEAARRRDSDVRPAGLTTDPVGEDVIDIDERARVGAAMGSLTDLQREAIEMAFYEGLTYREVAGKLGLPLGTVKTRIRDGLIRLAEAMGTAHG